MIRTIIIKIDPKNPDKSMIKKAAETIKKGGLVAFPTETVYGLGADYFNAKAIEKLYEVKNRPRDKPFTVHIANLKMLDKLSCEMTETAQKLVKKFWPGPLTLILKAKKDVKIGIRMPANKVAMDFISACGNPIVAPSANISGNDPPQSAGEVLFDLKGKIDLILDAGKTEIGIESTIIDVSETQFKVIRSGAISISEIAHAL